ncbi:MAG: DUF2610 domain-containing protein [Rickettsia endosymbiont of Pentastiridius leporinus]
MKKFDIDVNFGGQTSKFTIYVGTPQDGHHPLQHQAKWLADARGGTIPDSVMEALKQLAELAKKNGVPLEDLCVYALGSAQETQATPQEEEEKDENNEDNKTEQA